MSGLTFEPLVPAALWLTLGTLSAGMLGWYALRRPSVISRRRWCAIVTLMSMAIALVLVILLNPTWVRELPPPPGKPLLTVLVDASASMATPDAADAKSRFEAAVKASEMIVRELSDRFEIRVRSFDTTPSAADPLELAVREPQGKSTDLAAAIAGAVDHDRPQGQAVALLSDGIHNSEGGTARVLEAVRVARSMTVPIYARTYGGDVSGWDVGVELRSAQDLAVIGQKVPVTARVKFRGGEGAGRCELILLQEGKEVSRQPVVLQAGQPGSDVTFIVAQEQIGVYSYEVRATPLPGETSQANNSASYLLRVINEPIRVLVLEGKPYWDSKFFLRTLAADPAVALDSVVQVARGRVIRRTLTPRQSPEGRDALARRAESWNVLTDPASVLADPDALGASQIVVIGRDAEPFLTEVAITNLQRWLSRQGGSLVCYRGSPTSQVNQRLARLLPVKWTPAAEARFRIALTDEGKDLQWMLGGEGVASGASVLGQLPTLAAAERVVDAKPLAVALAVAVWPHGDEPAPAVVYQPYGSGRAVVIEGSGMWRWAFLPPQYRQHEQVYASLWHSLLHWLTSGAGLLPGQTMSLRTDKVTFATDEPASLTLLVRDDKGAAMKLPQVQLAADGSEETRAFVPAPLGDEAGVYRVSFGKLAEGRYRAQVVGTGPDDASARVVFDVRSFGEEQLNLQARPDLMARIANDSGGVILQADLPGEIAENFKQHMSRARPPLVERAAAWDHWWLLLGVIALWCISWSLRRAGGLV